MKVIFSTSNYKYLLKAFLDYQDLYLHKNSIGSTVGTVNPKSLIEGELYVDTFPDGETYHRFGSSLAGKHIIIIGGTVTDTETLELYDMACHCAKTGARSITLIIPYFGYSTMERAVQHGEVVKAKSRARLLSSIPTTSRTRILFMDLHSEGTPHYLEGGIQPVHLYAKRVIIEMCKKITLSEDRIKDYKENTDFVLASTDAGRAKWVESLANEMHVDCAILTKRRSSGTSTAIVGINADVKDKNVVIYDDMIRTGGSLIGAGKAYKEAGAKNVFAVATHGVLPTESIYNLKKSKVFERVYVTNTHPQAQALKNLDSKILNGFFDVYDMSPIFYRYLVKH